MTKEFMNFGDTLYLLYRIPLDSRRLPYLVSIHAHKETAIIRSKELMIDGSSFKIEEVTLQM